MLDPAKAPEKDIRRNHERVTEATKAVLFDRWTADPIKETESPLAGGKRANGHDSVRVTNPEQLAQEKPCHVAVSD